MMLQLHKYNGLANNVANFHILTLMPSQNPFSDHNAAGTYIAETGA